jgi:hypothetical protein
VCCGDGARFAAVAGWRAIPAVAAVERIDYFDFAKYRTSIERVLARPSWKVLYGTASPSVPAQVEDRQRAIWNTKASVAAPNHTVPATTRRSHGESKSRSVVEQPHIASMAWPDRSCAARCTMRKVQNVAVSSIPGGDVRIATSSAVRRSQKQVASVLQLAREQVSHNVHAISEREVATTAS